MSGKPTKQETAMSELALKLIAKNKKTRNTYLDLGNCGLTELPQELGELVWLETLILSADWHDWAAQGFYCNKTNNEGASNNGLNEVAPISKLFRLRRLVANNTKITDLTPLVGLCALQSLDLNSTPVIDLAPLSCLAALQQLYLDSTQTRALTPLSGLATLQWLHLNSTQVTDLAALASLGALKRLYFASTQVTDLAPLRSLGALRRLKFNATQVTDLAPLAKLRALRRVDLSSTQVTDLAPLRHLIQFGREVSLEQLGGDIRVYDCPLTSPPVEIVAQGNGAILNYFRELDVSGIDHLYEAKMLILGEGGAGKTSLLRRLYQPDSPLPEEQETTKGIAIHRHDFPLPNGRDFRLNVWDFGGQEIYHATHQFFLTRRSLYVLLDDTRRSDKAVSDLGFKYWLDVIELFGGDSPVLIFQNEKGNRSKTIDFDGIRARYPHVMKSFNGNLEHAQAALAIREGIDSFASRLPHIGEQLPAAWVKVRADIETAAQTQPHISLQQYMDIYQRHLPANRVKALHLSQYLHDLGVFLHFQDDKLLAKTVILQNQWATEAVYKLLDDEQIKAKKGRFNDEDCARLWAGAHYADMHMELVALMRHFELCYLLPDSTPTTWLAPQLLAATKPQPLRDWNQAGDLVLRYRYAIMPRGLISRLLVRLHRFVPNPETACITAVLFEQTETAVLAELSADGREIELRARGPERKALLSVVAADLEAINDGFHGLRNKVDKLIPCDCPQCSACKTPHLFDEKRLRKRVEDRELKIECPLSYKKDVDVLALLDGIRMAQLPQWAKEVAEDDPPPSATHNATSAPNAPNPSSQTSAKLRPFNIFLASSKELRQDRDEFDLYIRQLNDHIIEFGIYLKITRWENFLDAMSGTRLQDEYNQAVRASDVFVSLFSTKAGKFTEEEFDAAFGAFKASNRPYVYTYFKATGVNAANAPREDLQSLWAFQDKLKAHGHFPTNYDGIEHLKRQFRDQLDKLLAMGGHEPANMGPIVTTPAPAVGPEAQPEKGLFQKLRDIFR
jgi:internalin A